MANIKLAFTRLIFYYIRSTLNKSVLVQGLGKLIMHTTKKLKILF